MYKSPKFDTAIETKLLDLVENKVESVVENKVESKVDSQWISYEDDVTWWYMGLRRTRMMVVQLTMKV